jgi:hypothetical protein
MAQEKMRKTEEEERKKKDKAKKRLREEKTKTYRGEIYHVCRSNNFFPAV